MAQIMGKSMRFVIHVPIATGRKLVQWAKVVGMNEAAFTSAALVIGGRSLAMSSDLVEKLTPDQLLAFGELAQKDAAEGASAGRKRRAAKKEVKQ